MIARFGAVSYRLARRIVIGVMGGTVLLLGIVMLVAPGPGLLVIPLGLGILGIEFAWARIWLRRLKDSVGPEVMAGAARGYRRLLASLRIGVPPERPGPETPDAGKAGCQQRPGQSAEEK